MKQKIYNYDIWDPSIDLDDANNLLDVYQDHNINKSFYSERKIRELNKYDWSEEYINHIIDKPLNNEGLLCC